MADFNRRFAVAPRNPADAHRAVLHDAAELDLILCEQCAQADEEPDDFQSREYQVMEKRGHFYFALTPGQPFHTGVAAG